MIDAGRTGSHSLSFQDALLPLFAVLFHVATAVVAQTSGLASRPPWPTTLGIEVHLLLLGGLLVDLVLAPLSLRRQQRRPRGSPGRERLSVVALASLVEAAGLLALALSLTLSSSRWSLVLPAAALAALGSLARLGATLSCWPLLPDRGRARLLAATDLLLLAATAYAVTQLPVRPPEDAPDRLQLPVIRHVITTLFAVRLLTRLLPLMLDLIERIGFRPLVASRHLRSKKSGFLAAISVLSVLAVTLSSCALTTTLSVMGGFRHDLKRKILGNNAHIVIDREYATIEGWDKDLAAVRATGGVVGAAPYASGEVMISSAANLGTAVLRGIDPQQIGAVNDLPRNLRSGKLSYLSAPQQLLELPPDPSPGMGLAPATGNGGPPGPAAGDAGMAGGRAATADAATADAGMGGRSTPTPPDATAGPPSAVPDQALANLVEPPPEAGLPERLTALEAFVRRGPLAGDATTEDVLPGIIIGQELARSLRVYLGDEVNVVSPLGALGPSGPMPKTRPFRVAGIFYSGMYEYDIKFTYVSLETAQRFLGIGDAISGIEVRADNVDQAPAIAGRLRHALQSGDLRVKDWQELNSRLFGALALEKLAMFIALGIAILVASFCIAGTLTLMVQEKGREVAILKAMGSTDQAIIGVFVVEGGLIGVLGATLGLFLGYMMCFAAEHFGIHMNPEVYYIDRLPVHMDPTEFALTGLAAVLICLLITVYPALLASRLRPVDALRYE